MSVGALAGRPGFAGTGEESRSKACRLFVVSGRYKLGEVQMKSKNTLFWSVLAAVALSVPALILPRIAVGDLNVPALACQAPFLYQAEGLRWHEHYLMNPTNNQGTWVVCPLPIESDNMTTQFVIGAFGNFLAGASNESPFCYLNIIDLQNQHLQGFIENPGQRKIYTRLLQTQNPVNTLWWVATQVSTADIVAAIGQSCVNAADCWGVSVNCYLPVGHGLNMVSQY
jgi:hypothetical protein